MYCIEIVEKDAAVGPAEPFIRPSSLGKVFSVAHRVVAAKPDLLRPPHRLPFFLLSSPIPRSVTHLRGEISHGALALIRFSSSFFCIIYYGPLEFAVECG